MQHYAIARILTKMYETCVDQRYQKMWDNNWLNDTELALYATVQVSCDNYGFERDGNTSHDGWERHSRYYLHFVIHKRHRVYLAITDHHVSFHEAQKLVYLNIGNHDSCYRDSIEREIGNHYFKVYQEAWSHMPEEHCRAPIECDINISMYDCFGELFEFVTVKRERIEDTKESNCGYLDRLVSFEKLEVTMKPNRLYNGAFVRIIDKEDSLTGTVMTVEHYEPETGYLRLRVVNNAMFYTCYTEQQLELV